MRDAIFIGIAQSRVKGLRTRLGLAGFLGGTAMLLEPSIWPVVWFLVYFVSQIIDNNLFKAALKNPKKQGDEAKFVIAIALSTLIFSGMAAYTWIFGGEEGRIFAVISICGALLHVTLQLYNRRTYLFAGLLPHALYLLFLPSVTAVIEPGHNSFTLFIVNVGTFVFLGNLAWAVRQNNQSLLDLKVAKDEAQEARKLAENESAAKTNFLAVITHEIRTPMNAVLSAANLLKRTPLNDEQSDHVRMLSNASEVLMGLLNDVLDISKIEAGKMSIERAAIDLRDLVTGVGQLWSPQAQVKNVRLLLEMEDDLPSQIMIDPLRLRQILFNLLSNAVKFTAKGLIIVRVYRLPSASGHTELRFDVEDQGIGIAGDQLERIFSSFEQADAGTTRRYGGTGLGLAISRKLAQLMGGDISVRSSLGHGSCFSLSLPYDSMLLTAVDMPEGFDADEADEAPVEGPRTILIVDDHEVNRRIVSLFVQPLGWRWVMAENGQQAVDLCRSEAFDIILMDMQMPVMGGIEATKLIRAQDGPNQDTPIVALTANAMEHHQKAWAEAGVEDFLAKPIDPDLLINTLIAKSRINPLRAAA